MQFLKRSYITLLSAFKFITVRILYYICIIICVLNYLCPENIPHQNLTNQKFGSSFMWKQTEAEYHILIQMLLNRWKRMLR